MADVVVRLPQREARALQAYARDGRKGVVWASDLEHYRRAAQRLGAAIGRAGKKRKVKRG